MINIEQDISATDKYINKELLYLFRKDTKELNGLSSDLGKFGAEVDVLSKGQIMQDMDFMETADANMDQEAMGIN